MYGSFGDFSYTDSLSDISPTIANRWNLDDDADLVDKRTSSGYEQSKEMINGKFVIGHTLPTYEKTVKITDDKSNDIINAQTKCDLTTINEESHSMTESPQI